MSHAIARHESQETVNSVNLFVDSERSPLVGNGSSKGDDVEIHFEGNSLEAGDGEMLRISLTNFTMFNNLYHVDINNSRFIVRNANTTTDSTQNLTRKNYKTIKDIATDFMAQVGAGVVAVSPNTITYTAGSSSVTTPTETNMGESGNRLLDITVAFSGAHGIAAADLIIKTTAILGDTYTILGGLRVDPSDDEDTKSFIVTVPTTSTVRVQGYFPMQRMSDPYVYLRCDAANNGLEMSVLDSARHSNLQREIIHSNIIGKMFRDVEFISYNSIGAQEYFINLQQRRLSSLRLFLTDSKGNRLGRLPANVHDGTAAGKETADVFDNKLQNTIGNLFFTCVLRIDTVRMSIPRYLESVPPPPPLPAHEAQSVLVWPDYGRPKY
jgi:hypothetical protein